jgi:AraC-like DNA-binding protein
MPTDIGWYPHARYHYRERRQGAEEHILIFCTAGGGLCEVEDQWFAVEANEVVVIPRGTPHLYRASDEVPWSIHWVHFIGSEGDFFVNQLPPNENKMMVDTQCADIMKQLFEESYVSFVGGFVLHRLIYCAQIIRHLLGNLFFNNSAFSPTQRANRFRSIEPTLSFLRQHIYRSITLAEMAQHAGLSPSHFSYLFKQQTGFSPLEYFLHLKVQHACGQLLMTQKPIREIAQEVGFDDPYYFSRVFKRVIGVSPRQYRQDQPI